MSQKIGHLMLHHNFGKCEQIFKVLSTTESQGNL